MGRAAIDAARAVDYFNAGTVEFLLDRDGNFYFMEINARIQVEHPVTEMVTGVDLVKEQIRLADGGKLDYTFDDLNLKGWAIECRINTEDPDFNFMPCPGTIEEYNPPGGFGVRLDTHLYQGYELPIFYDSLVGQARRVRPDARRGDPRPEKGAPGVHDSAGQDNDPLVSEDHGRPRLPGRGHPHRIRKEIRSGR